MQNNFSTKPVGLTKDAGFEMGVRRTMSVGQEEIWTYLLSPSGLRAWLGELAQLPAEKGKTYETGEGHQGEMRVFKPMEQLRLTWRRSDWTAPSTVQIRLMPSSPGKTTVSFHQEKLAGPMQREEMKRHWEQVLKGLEERFESVKR